MTAADAGGRSTERPYVRPSVRRCQYLGAVVVDAWCNEPGGAGICRKLGRDEGFVGGVGVFFCVGWGVVSKKDVILHIILMLKFFCSHF